MMLSKLKSVSDKNDFISLNTEQSIEREIVGDSKLAMLHTDRRLYERAKVMRSSNLRQSLT